MQCPRRHSKRLQVRRTLIRDDCVRHIHQRLWQLACRNRGNNLIRGRIDRLHAVTVFQANVDATSITGAPDAVRQIVGLDGRDQFRRRARTAPIDEQTTSGGLDDEVPVRRGQDGPALFDPALQATASTLGMDARGSTPQEMRDRMAADVKKWAAVIEKAGIPKQ